MEQLARSLALGRQPFVVRLRRDAAEEWPEVKQGLEKRVDSHPAAVDNVTPMSEPATDRHHPRPGTGTEVTWE